MIYFDLLSIRLPHAQDLDNRFDRLSLINLIYYHLNI
jgi:hypothetical protein